MSREEYADDPEQTIIRPSPGGRRFPAAVSPDLPPGPRAVPEHAELRRLEVPGFNPLLSAGSFLFGLIARLRDRSVHRDIDDLRNRVISEIRGFEASALGAGIPADQIRAARYAVAATVDDLVLNTPWGSQSIWTHRGMVSSLYNETAGGERFFELLTQLENDPARNANVLELFYLCLSLGFEGKYRVLPRGSTELSQVRDGLFRLLRARQPEIERELSPHWRGVAAIYRPVRAVVPVWVILVVLAGLLTAVFWGFDLWLNRQSDTTFASLQAIAPRGPIQIARAEPVAAPTPAPAAAEPAPSPPAPVATDGTYQRISTFLKPEVDQGLVTVSETPDTVMVRIRGANMFRSGSSTITDSFQPLLQRIGQALDAEPGTVVVAGHTDNVPIRSLRFPSNWHLSVARAQSVVDQLDRYVSDPARLTAEGRADAEPIASNDTAEGREANRRIEILLRKPT